MTPRSRFLLLLAAACGGASPALAAGGTETALLATGTLLFLLVAVILFILVLPEDDRRALAASAARFRTIFMRGTVERVAEFDHEFDGIRELDNRIPPWFTLLFGGTILFAAIYLVDYHVVGASKLMIGEYQDDVAAAAIQRRIVMASEGTIDENTLTAVKDPAVLKRGSDEFARYCISCHGRNGEGLIGPNLTDDFWIHGGGIKNVYATIKNGVPAKGMISWQLVFTPRQIQEIGSFVLSLHGTNPPNGKKPEGDRWVAPPDTATAPPPAAAATL
jgi:mono/diheme cytochrome c family protein